MGEHLEAIIYSLAVIFTSETIGFFVHLSNVSSQQRRDPCYVEGKCQVDYREKDATTRTAECYANLRELCALKQQNEPGDKQ